MKPAQRRGSSLSSPDFASLQGVWRSQGYGTVLLIEEDWYTLFEETSISCRKIHAGSARNLCVIVTSEQAAVLQLNTVPFLQFAPT